MSIEINDQQPQTPRSVIEVMDEEFLKEGWTREELDIQRRTGDLIVALLADGKSVDEINSLGSGHPETEPVTKSPVRQRQQPNAPFPVTPFTPKV